MSDKYEVVYLISGGEAVGEYETVAEAAVSAADNGWSFDQFGVWWDIEHHAYRDGEPIAEVPVYLSEVREAYHNG